MAPIFDERIRICSVLRVLGNLSCSLIVNLSQVKLFFKSLNSVYNSFVYLKTTKKFLKTFYLLFFNRYAFGYYSIKKRNLKVRKLLAFSPIYMVVLSPLLFLKNFCIFLYKKAKKS